jgi:DNA uptake protein ComE-like DNA-binding protein
MICNRSKQSGQWMRAKTISRRAVRRSTVMPIHRGNVSERTSSVTTEPNAPTIAPESRVDINFATIDELLKVPGMTRTWAARIIRFRPYRTKLDLLERGVLTSEVYSRVQDYVIAHRTKQ